MNKTGECTHCSDGCVKCAGQHHQEMEIHHYKKEMHYEGEPVKIVPVKEIEEILKLSVCDEVRAIAGRWLR